MQLAIIHYHLNRGGVTQVIHNHLLALAETTSFPRSIDRVLVLHGGRREGWPERVFNGPSPFEPELIAVPELEYDSSPVADPCKLANHICAAVTVGGRRPEGTLLHIHNHCLGKNASLPGAICELAADGFRQLLQVHDFAEDFRPTNYRHLETALGTDRLAERVYPQTPSIHYSALNGRDLDVLTSAGLKSERLHLLHNPVSEFHNLPAHDIARAEVSKAIGTSVDDPLIVYPVRGIRRKNIGEILLLASLDERPATYAVTLAPLNPAEAESFSFWIEVAAELDLRCRFDIGPKHNLAFATILSAADAIVTTSVAEGFGMVFLECWLAGRPLVGRNLTEITGEFLQSGIQLDGMYDRLGIPVSLVRLEEIEGRMIEKYNSICESYGRPLTNTTSLSEGFQRLVVNETIDFAYLGRADQRRVIQATTENETVREQIRRANPLLDKLFRVDAEQNHAIIGENAAATREHFSLVAVGTRLREIYDSIPPVPAEPEIESLPQADAILKSFLDLRRLQPIRL